MKTKTSLIEALTLAEVALKHSAPTANHYPEPVQRHNIALAAVREHIEAFKQLREQLKAEGRI